MVEIDGSLGHGRNIGAQAPRVTPLVDLPGALRGRYTAFASSGADALYTTAAASPPSTGPIA